MSKDYQYGIEAYGLFDYYVWTGRGFELVDYTTQEYLWDEDVVEKEFERALEVAREVLDIDGVALYGYDHETGDTWEEQSVALDEE